MPKRFRMTDSAGVVQNGNSKTTRYDRQVRIWGDAAQRKLSNSSILLINATAVGSETLKNLVLPGIGSVTILDDSPVSDEDLRRNFYISVDDIGKPRSNCVIKTMKEMNPDVKMHHIAKNLKTILSQTPEFFGQFNLVISNDLNFEDLTSLSQYLHLHNVPLVNIQSHGLFSIMEFQSAFFPVCAADPKNTIFDFRLLKPFPNLVQFLDSIDISALSAEVFSHVPYPVLIWKAMQRMNKIKFNISRPEIMEIKNFIEKEFVSSHTDENVSDAIKNVEILLTPRYSLSSQIQKLFERKNEELQKKSMDSTHLKFWIHVSALERFYRKYGFFPLSGSLPDMHSSTEYYIALQKLYKQQMLFEETEFLSFCDSMKSSIEFDLEQVHNFCKCASELNLIECQPIGKYNLTDEKILSAINSFPLDISPFLYDTYCRYRELPGFDTKILIQEYRQRFQILDVPAEHQTSIIQFVEELLTSFGCELNSTTSYLGGVAANEIIKIIIQRFSPINDTYIYEAVRHSGVTLKR